MREIRFQIDDLYDPDYAGPKAECNKRENIIRRLARQKQAAEKYARRRGTVTGADLTTPEEEEQGEAVQYDSHSGGEEYDDEVLGQDDEDAQCEPDHPQESRSEQERPG